MACTVTCATAHATWPVCCMADLSLSTDTWVNDHQRVIDVIRDSLFLFAESLAATGDRFAMYGFSSRRRDPVRVHQLKTFDECYDGARAWSHRRRSSPATTPAWVRRCAMAATAGAQPAGRRLLLLLTDGKPNDLDKYEGRYGIEDTRHAVMEARQQGLQPFCVTIDKQANDYLPHLFGKQWLRRNQESRRAAQAPAYALRAVDRLNRARRPSSCPVRRYWNDQDAGSGPITSARSRRRWTGCLRAGPCRSRAGRRRSR